MSDGRERRRHKRIAVTWPGEAQTTVDESATVEIVNVSEDGLGIVSQSPMRPGERYRFKFAGWAQEPVDGVVRWSEVGKAQTYAGIEFESPTLAQSLALRELIGRYDKEDWGV
jgi:hypothetical protein